jgi:hypothetical protein
MWRKTETCRGESSKGNAATPMNLHYSMFQPDTTRQNTSLLMGSVARRLKTEDSNKARPRTPKTQKRLLNESPSPKSSTCAHQKIQRTRASGTFSCVAPIKRPSPSTIPSAALCCSPAQRTPPAAPFSIISVAGHLSVCPCTCLPPIRVNISSWGNF